MTSDEYKIGTAIHESGHGLAAAIIGYPLEWLTIEPSAPMNHHEIGDSAGHVMLDRLADSKGVLMGRA
jgi:hypothetical protein